jgi:hypothetical protein
MTCGGWILCIFCDADSIRELRVVVKDPLRESQESVARMR